MEVYALHDLGFSHAANGPWIICFKFADGLVNLFHLNEPKYTIFHLWTKGVYGGGMMECFSILGLEHLANDI